MLDTEDKRKAPETGATVHGRAIAANATRVADTGDDARRFRLAVSSETPVERWYGNEILVHERGAINLEFFGSGRAPLLLDHDSRRQIGVVEKVSLDSDRVLRATVRFGKGAEAAATMADVEDGIRANVSVGYRINDFKSLPKDAGYRITDWTPMEVSIVSIPADPSVGVGRSDQQPTKPTHGNRKMKPETIEDDARAADDRFEAMNEARDKAERHGVLGAWREAFTTDKVRGMTADEIRSKSTEFVLANLPKSKPIADNRGMPGRGERSGYLAASPAVWSGEREHNQYRVLDAINTQLDPRGGAKHAGLVIEVDAELRLQTGRSFRGIGIPPNALAPLSTRSALDATDVSALVNPAGSSDLFVDALKKRLGIAKLGATTLAGMGKNFSIPRGLVSTTASWVIPGQAPTESAPTFGSIDFVYKQLSATMGWTRQVSVQSAPYLEDITRRDMLGVIAVGVESAAVNGAGSATVPRGILNTVGINAVVFGTNGAALSRGKLLEIIAAPEIDNIEDGNHGWLMNSNTWVAGMRTPSESGHPKYLIQDEHPDQLLGAPIAISNVVPSDLVKGTSGAVCSGLIYSKRWNELFIAQFGGIDVHVQIDAPTANVTIGVHSDWDIGLRLEEAFCIAKDVLTN